jgi:hypothetical protein
MTLNEFAACLAATFNSHTEGAGQDQKSCPAKASRYRPKIDFFGKRASLRCIFHIRRELNHALPGVG